MIFLLASVFRPALGPTQRLVQWGSFSGSKARLGRDADRSISSRTEVENEWSYTSSPPSAVVACSETVLAFSSSVNFRLFGLL
jgi:hypothetical protein